MPYTPIERLTRTRPPRPPARVAENLELEQLPPDEAAFSHALWRQVLAQEIRKARAQARDRNDPDLKRKLRELYRTLWGGRRLPASRGGSALKPGQPQMPAEQRKARD